MDGDRFDPTTGEVLPAVSPQMPPEIAKAIIVVAKGVKQLGTTDENQHGRYKYVSVDRFYEVIGKLMRDAGLALIIDEIHDEVREGKSGNPWLFMRYNLMFMHESGATSPPMRRSCALPISGPQAFGAAQSYTEKQFLRQVFKVPTGEKDADDTAPAADNAAPASAPRQQHQRQQPTPGPDQAAKTESVKRWTEMRDEIDRSESASDLRMLTDSERCPAWKAMCEHVRRAEGVMADAVIKRLVERAEARIEQLIAAESGGARTEGYS